MILTAPTARPLATLIGHIGRLLPRGWADLAKQLTLFAVLDLAYELSRVIAASPFATPTTSSRPSARWGSSTS